LKKALSLAKKRAREGTRIPPPWLEEGKSETEGNYVFFIGARNGGNCAKAEKKKEVSSSSYGGAKKEKLGLVKENLRREHPDTSEKKIDFATSCFEILFPEKQEEGVVH